MLRPILRPLHAVAGAIVALAAVVAAPAFSAGEHPRAPCEPVSDTADAPPADPDPDPAPRAFRSAAEYSHGDPTSDEQLFLELMNRARQHPADEAERVFDDYGDADVKGAVNHFIARRRKVEYSRAENRAAFLSYAPQPPFAFNARLLASARGHTARMIAADRQDHELPGELKFSDRIRAEGYDFAATAESIFAFAKSMVYAHAGFAIDWGQDVDPGESRPSLRHRNSLMNFDGTRDFVEVGVGVTPESKPSTDVGPKVMTIDFARPASSATRFVTGVCFDDRDGDGFYDPGEGLAGVRIESEASAFFTVSSSSGGYSLPLPANAGSIVVRATGEVGGPSERVGVQDVPVTMAGVNVKVDFTKPPDPPPPAAQTFSRTEPFGLAGSGGVTTSMIDVPAFDADGGIASDIDVSVALTHPDASLLKIEILSPAGTPVVLWDHGLPVADLSGTFDDSLAPVENPGRLAGESYVGSWTIRFTDGSAGAANVLRSWAVTVRPSWVRPLHADRTNLGLTTFKATDSAKPGGDSLKIAGAFDAGGAALSDDAPVLLRLLRDDGSEIRRFSAAAVVAPESMTASASVGVGGTSKATFKAMVKGIDFAGPLPSPLIVEVAAGGAVARQRIVTTRGALSAAKPPSAPYFRVSSVKSSIADGDGRATTVTGRFAGGLVVADTIEVFLGDTVALVSADRFTRKGSRWTAKLSGIVRQVVIDTASGEFSVKLQGEHQPVVDGVVPFSFRVGATFGETVVRPSGTTTLKY